VRVLGAVSVVVSASACSAPLPASDAHPDLNCAPRAVLVTALDGATVALPEPGHVTVVDVWATWCTPCAETAPEVEALWGDARSEGVRVVGVATDDDPRLVERSAMRQDLTYPNVVDVAGEVRGWLKVREVPTLVVFDRRGRIRWVRVGAGQGGLASMRGVVAALERE
jgi:thiol-disulfide isomerase/thioredoxin